MAEALSDADARFAAQVEEVVLRDLEADRLELPPLPMVAVRIFQLLANPDYRTEEVAALIETDPLLAAQVLRLTNSPTFAARQPLTSIKDCVSRLGRLELRMFLFEVSARQLIESRDPRIADLSRGLWEHSLAVALLTREITRFSDRPQLESGYLAGLLHDVGKPLLASLLAAAEQRLHGPRTGTWLPAHKWLRFILTKHRSVGVALARKWKLPDLVSQSIADGSEYDSVEPRSLANAVRLANGMAKVNGLYVGAFDRDEVAALVFVGQQLFNLEARALDALVASVREEIRQRAS